MYTDATDVDINPNHLNEIKKEITTTEVLSIDIAANGGAAIQLKKK